MKFFVIEQVEHTHAPPEKVLWLAVIERAMLDVVYPTKEISVSAKMGLFNFFYEDVPKPYNLVYICTNMFDYPDAADVIRARLQKLQAKQGTDIFVRSKRYKGFY